MDLKAILVEAKQKVPPVLQVLQTGDETMLDIGGEPFNSWSCLHQERVPNSCVYACTSCTFLTVSVSNVPASRISRREGLYVLWWSGSPYHRLSKAGGHADQAGLQPRAKRLPGS